MDPGLDPEPEPDPEVTVEAAFSVSPDTPEVGDQVTLDGSASTVEGATALDFNWALTAPDGSAAAIDDPEAETTTFTADVEGAYTITLEVSAGDAMDSASGGVDVIEPAPEVVEIASDITEDRTLSAASLYRVTSNIDIEAVLTIEPGTRIEFEEGRMFSFREGSILIADGTAEEPIVFTGTQATPGWWDGLWIRETNHPDNLINYAIIEYGGRSSFSSSVSAANLAVGRLSSLAAVTVTNTTLRHSGNYGLFSTEASALPGFANNTITDNAAPPVRTRATNLHYLDEASDLTGNAEDHIYVRNADVKDEDVRWRALSVPYQVEGTTEVEEVAVMIDPGVQLMFEQGAELRFRAGSRIIADGTAEAPIHFSATVASPGWWDGLWISESDHPANLINHAIIEYGGRSSFSSSVSAANLAVGRLSSQASVTVTNTTIRHGASYGLFSTEASALPGFASNTITDNAAPPVRVRSNNMHYLDEDTDFTGNAEDYIYVRNTGVNDTDVRWRALTVPYQMTGGTTVRDVAVTIDPGVELAFDQAARLRFREGSTLTADGTAETPIRFTAMVETPGWWDGLWISESEDPNNLINHAIIEYGGRTGFVSSVEGGNLVVGRLSSPASVTVTNAVIRHSDRAGIWASSDAQVNADICSANEFSNNQGSNCVVDD